MMRDAILRLVNLHIRQERTRMKEVKVSMAGEREKS